MEETVFYKSPVGALQIVATEKGINCVSFVNKSGYAVTDELSIVYNLATSPLLIKCVRQLDAYFAGSLHGFELEITQTGTPFQQQVWNQLVNIPFGKTISYLALSKKIGNVKSIRAVGMANGRNRVAIIVPCHRVIGSDGSLVGYAGDLWRKKWLLDHEAGFAHGVQQLF
jgi:methylated-DNA-[protein]-cysteine S-methyltransferase